jgi:peptidoglycan/LPS O-acetylase OafA/YrhL
MSLERLGVRDFLVRRVFRIYPVLWLSIALWAILYGALEAGGHADVSSLGFFNYLGNALLLPDLFRVETLNPILWTLLVEIKFYAIAALLVLVHRQWRNPLLTGLAAACVLAVLQFALSVTASYLAYMVVGTAAYLWWSGRARPGVAIAAGLAAFALFASWMIVRNGAQFAYIVEDGCRSAFLFVAVLVAERRIARWPAATGPIAAALDWLGRVSYPLYHFHAMVGLPVIAFVHMITGNLTVALLTAAIVVFPLSWFAHLAVEEPFRKLGARVGVAAFRRPPAAAVQAGQREG